jgi:peptide-methionine (R)-S-oxide reductase
MHRRSFIKLAAGGACMLLFPGLLRAAQAPERIAKISRTDAEWRRLLTPAQYRILREADTERPFSSPLDHETRSGVYVCAGCALELFPSRFKYDSGTGWPSFYDVLPGRIETREDLSFAMVRTEYHCARCGGHQGHVFDDGPKPTGLRYCNNGLALRFIPEKE